ncbi:phosphatase PAP2 family protein [candidate division WOR-3 bacterium]|nr:phosphatase PAP2 family protein [candidate division WOR-3 bacterium]
MIGKIVVILVPVLVSASWQREALDWGIIGGSTLGGGLCALSYPIFEKPLIEGPGDKPYKEDLIPNSWVLAGGLAGVGLVSLLPNQDGWLNDRSYRHLKGGIQALTVGFFIKDFGKIFFGRPRPDYYDRIQQGIEVKKARKSFPSGHATHAFTTATYLALYTWDEWRSDDPWAVAVKSGITALLATGAGWIGYTRIKDNRHYPGDVIAGSILGAGTALFFYSYQLWWKPEEQSNHGTGAVYATWSMGEDNCPYPGNAIEGSTPGTSTMQISIQLVSIRF